MSAPTYSLRCVFASLPKVERGKSVNLGGHDKGINFLYYNGNNVYIRDIEDCTKCDIYSEHSAPVTVAKYSSTGFYIASGDTTGKVRIWDTVNKEHVLKNEFPVLGGPVKDIGWGDESKKIAVVGEGREFYTKVMSSEMGTTVGDIGGHSKHVNGVAFKPNRPFRICTASEDQSARFYEGPPFKYKKSLTDHTNFVNCVKYSPKGDVFVTGGADGMAFVYDGKDAELLGSLGEKAHNGGIYAMDFSDDGSEILTVSGDKTAKIWNVASRELVVEFSFGNELENMMLGCLWQKDNVLVVTLAGYIYYMDRNNPTTPRRILKGHYRPITSMGITPGCSNIYTGGSDGQIYCWDARTGLCELIKGKGHDNQVSDMVIIGDTMISIGMDDVIRYTRLTGMDSNQYGSDATKLPSQPRAVAATPGGASVIACIEHIAVADKGNVTFQQGVRYEPTCVDIHPGGTCVVFGTNKDHNLYIYDFDGSTLTNLQKFPVEDTVSCVKFSPDGAYLVATLTSKRHCKLLKYGPKLEEVYSLSKQTAKIFSVAWSPNSRYYATGSLDGSIAIWQLDKKFEANVAIFIREAHVKGCVNNVGWLSDNTVVSAGNDSNVKLWDLKLE